MKVFILSPHIDDAAFGLALTISECVRNSVEVTIINCFTISRWTAIAVDNKEISAVSRMRKKEDTIFYRSIDPSISILNLDLLDAPLRNGYIFQEQSFQQNEIELIDELHGLLQQHVHGLLFCPVGIGYHIDHAICRAAVLKSYKDQEVIFYEDLPYAERITETELTSYIQGLEDELSVSLTNDTCYINENSVKKIELIHLYKTQMNEEIANEIHRRLNTLQGERFWGEKKILTLLKEVLKN